MSRYWYALIGALLLGFIIVGGMFYVNEVTLHMEELLTQSRILSEQGDMEQAQQLLSDCQTLWEQKRKGLEAMLDHTSLEQVSIFLAESRVFLHHQALPHFHASCQKIFQTLRALREDQQIGFHNLF